MLPMSETGKKPAARKMREYRERLRRSGLRPIQIWAPDPRAPGFAARLRMEVSGLDRAHERNALVFIEAASSEA